MFPHPPGSLIYVALGSNVGDSVLLLGQAIDRLQDFSSEPIRRSSLWRSAPVDCPPDSADFINAVVELVPRPDESPESLLRNLQQLEREFGRKRKNVMNEPRPLDLDIIAFGEERRKTVELILPHPRAHQRLFVLAPLAELAPELQLPGQTQTVAELLLTLGPGQAVKKLP
jgi:2-amino-4-hydroxy-6-hydroxymethyldihydropteridine diphosphokinase